MILTYGLTSPESLFAGLSAVACLTDALTGGTGESGDPTVPAGGTPAGVKLLEILFPGPLQVGQSGPNVVGGCAEAH